MHRTFSDRSKFIAGAFLIALGIVVLSGKLDHALAQLNHLVSTVIAKALWALPDAILTVSRVLHTDVAHPRSFVQSFPRGVSISVAFVRRLIEGRFI
jgi:uncharacterized membrane protein